MKRFLYILPVVIFLASIFFINTVQAQAPYLNEVKLSFFESEICPHCAAEEIFLDKLVVEHPNVVLRKFEISKHPENYILLTKVAKALNVSTGGVPFLVVGDRAIVGYLNEETTGRQIEQAIELCEIRGCSDILVEVGFLEDENNDVIKDELQENKLTGEKITLPLFGEIDLGQTSLFLLTTAVAFLDGFNPCAMWILLFLITLLLGMENRRRRWILGSTFVFVSGLVYFLFLAAWLNIFLFIGMIGAVRMVIGLVAIISGYFSLRAWYRHKTGCVVENNEKRKRIFDKLRQIVTKQNFWLALGGIALLAIAVNLVELMCSAGLPAIYTQVLSLSELPRFSYYLYLIWYIIIFMLDDLIVFIVAMVSLQAFGISSKYSLASKLIGGLIILILGILLIFKPGLLMFG